jgi:glycerol-3-phosphate acyltransferase PlsY
MSHNELAALLLIGSYLLGSLPFGLWIAKLWKGVDIRTVGSGNIGSTNVGRVCGPVAGGLVFVLDVLKGFAPPLLARNLGLSSPWPLLAGLMAIVGHNYPIWLGFKGGKGIATSGGALFGVAPYTGLSASAVFLIVLLTLRYVSVGSIAAAFSLPFFMILFYRGDRYQLAFGIAAGVMAIYKHRSNILRLRAGTEPKVSLTGTKRTHLEATSPPSESPAGNREADPPYPDQE